MEELAEIALKDNPQKELILSQICDITEKGMNGEISFGESLLTRIELLKANKSHVEKLKQVLKKKISNSILRNKNFFKIYKDNIYIISGGFKEFIIPVTSTFGIADDHIRANTFLYDSAGEIIGVDIKNPLAGSEGKVKAVKALKLVGDIYIVGDGYTDYQLKEKGLVKKFIVFTENIERKAITQKADHIANSFDEFIALVEINNAP